MLSHDLNEISLGKKKDLRTGTMTSLVFSQSATYTWGTAGGKTSRLESKRASLSVGAQNTSLHIVRPLSSSISYFIKSKKRGQNVSGSCMQIKKPDASHCPISTNADTNSNFNILFLTTESWRFQTGDHYLIESCPLINSCHQGSVVVM